MFGVFSVFFLFSRGFLGFRGGGNSLVFWVVFLGIYLNTKEKKIQILKNVARQSVGATVQCDRITVAVFWPLSPT